MVGGGISGLAAAWRLKLRRPDADITVLEASARFGGKLISEHRDGFIVEAAADGFLARKPPALDWAEELGLWAQLIEPRPAHRFSQVLWDGDLHPMPEGFSGLVPGDPEALRRTTLLTPAGADRAAGESLVPPRTAGTEESVEQFFTRRYGAEAFERLMEPLLAGIFAGDASLLSAEAAFPQLTSLERQGRSLTAGPGASQQSAGPAFRSFFWGMAALPEAIESALSRLGVTLTPGQTVKAVSKSRGRFSVETENKTFDADAVILALPPRISGSLLRALSPAQSAVLDAWPVSSVANLNLAFHEADLPRLPQGSGFVAPRAGNTKFSAATWSSRKWPGRAPEGGLLVRVYFGGARDPEGWSRPESELVDAALELLSGYADRPPVPLWHRVFRWRDAFAQPNVGHAGRHQELSAASVPGLVLAGGFFAGPGIPDCLARAGQAAEAVDRFLANGDIEA